MALNICRGKLDRVIFRNLQQRIVSTSIMSSVSNTNPQPMMTKLNTKRHGSSSTSSSPPTSSSFATADLCDEFVKSPNRLQTAGSGSFKDYGGVTSFHGRIETVRCFESNPLVRKTLGESGQGRVLVVDGGGSQRVAILGDQLASMAYENNWSGLIINGCIRDSAVIKDISVGVKALGTHPLKSLKDYDGERGGRVSFAGLEFVPGDWIYVDEDGIIISNTELQPDSKL